LSDFGVLLNGSRVQEHSEDEVIGGLNLNPNVEESLSLLDKGCNSFSGAIKSIEAGVAVLSFNSLNLHLDLSPVVWTLVVEIGVSYFSNSSQDIVGTDFYR
jgi:hypothetical protein